MDGYNKKISILPSPNLRTVKAEDDKERFELIQFNMEAYKLLKIKKVRGMYNGH